MNGNNPAPDPYVTVSCTEASEQQPPCFVHWRARGRQERRARVCKIGLKNQFMDYWVLAAALGALEWLGELRFLWRLPGFPLLLLRGAICLALCALWCVALGARAYFRRALALSAFLAPRIFVFASRFLCLCL